MKRLDLAELHDREWFPQFLREDFVETLSGVLSLTGAYSRAVPLFAKWLRACRAPAVLDLASGAAGPVESLIERLPRNGVKPPRFILSDLFPNRGRFQRLKEAYPVLIDVVSRPLDARRVPAGCGGRAPHARSLFSSLHHFKPSQAEAILRDAVRHASGICLLEPFQRTPRHLLLSPLSVFPVLITPLMGSGFDAKRLLFTYLVPIIPVVMVVDTFLSVLRCYSREEIEGWIEALPANDYQWEIDSTSYMFFFQTTCVFGWRERREDSHEEK